ncbi:hypothetical protein [Paraburkholderia sacchari]|uniref:DNA-binding protein n=1 Tax=Paraburkholderia sacchari TaxID=159450 RepID=A0A8T6ZIZ3_9BURK|nr:hypothetical protein [Paraburkholderia sacchari]NLP64214.1 DNA-binding protein [Paraburkholderia sacchari]
MKIGNATTGEIAAINRSHFITTDQFAEALHVLPQSIRKRLCMTGSFHGIRPLKLPSRRLAWPVDAVEQLMNGGR